MAISCQRRCLDDSLGCFITERMTVAINSEWQIQVGVLFLSFGGGGGTLVAPPEPVPLCPSMLCYHCANLFIYSNELQIRCSAHTGICVGEPDS